LMTRLRTVANFLPSRPAESFPGTSSAIAPRSRGKLSWLSPSSFVLALARNRGNLNLPVRTASSAASR
jgi:hypothetical protein